MSLYIPTVTPPPSRKASKAREPRKQDSPKTTSHPSPTTREDTVQAIMKSLDEQHDSIQALGTTLDGIIEERHWCIRQLLDKSLSRNLERINGKAAALRQKAAASRTRRHNWYHASPKRDCGELPATSVQPTQQRLAEALFASNNNSNVATAPPTGIGGRPGNSQHPAPTPDCCGKLPVTPSLIGTTTNYQPQPACGEQPATRPFRVTAANNQLPNATPLVAPVQPFALAGAPNASLGDGEITELPTFSSSSHPASTLNYGEASTVANSNNDSSWTIPPSQEIPHVINTTAVPPKQDRTSFGRPTTTNPCWMPHGLPIKATHKATNAVLAEPPLFGTPSGTRLVPNETIPVQASARPKQDAFKQTASRAGATTNLGWRSRCPPCRTTPRIPSLVLPGPPLFGTPNATRLVPNERIPMAAMPPSRPSLCRQPPPLSDSSNNVTPQDESKVRTTMVSVSHVSKAMGSPQVFGMWFHHVFASMMAHRIGSLQSVLLAPSLDFRTGN